MATSWSTALKEKLAERNGSRRMIVSPVKQSARHSAAYNPWMHGGSRSQSTYIGEWVADKREGFGTQTWACGKKYAGEWKAGKPHGKGSFWKGTKGNLQKRYAGDWVQGTRTGLGVRMFSTGDKYEGEWYENKRQGRGTMHYANGALYQGGWIRNRRSGTGVLVEAGGNKYEGEWSDNCKEGCGRYVYDARAMVYEGTWQRGFPTSGTMREFSSSDTVQKQEVSSSGSHKFGLPALSLLEPDRVTLVPTCPQSV